MAGKLIKPSQVSELRAGDKDAFWDWVSNLKIVLKNNRMLDVVMPGIGVDGNGNFDAEDLKLDADARDFIESKVDSTLRLALTNAGTAKAAYDTIYAKFNPATVARKAELSRQLNMLRMQRGESVAVYCARARKLAHELLELEIIMKELTEGEDILAASESSETNLVMWVLTGLPESWENFKDRMMDSASSTGDLGVTMDQLQSKMENREQRYQDGSGVGVSASAVAAIQVPPAPIYPAAQSQEDQVAVIAAALNRLGFQPRGAGHGGNNGGGDRPRKDMLRVKCYRCKQFGHYADKCPQGQQQQGQLGLGGGAGGSGSGQVPPLVAALAQLQGLYAYMGGAPQKAAPMMQQPAQTPQVAAMAAAAPAVAAPAAAAAAAATGVAPQQGGAERVRTYRMFMMMAQSQAQTLPHGPSDWLLDSGCSSPVSYDPSDLFDLRPLLEPTFVQVADGRPCAATHIGNMILRTSLGNAEADAMMKDVLLVPELGVKALSISAMARAGVETTMGNAGAVCKSRDGEVVMRGRLCPRSGVYVISGRALQPSAEQWAQFQQ